MIGWPHHGVVGAWSSWLRRFVLFLLYCVIGHGSRRVSGWMDGRSLFRHGAVQRILEPVSLGAGCGRERRTTVVLVERSADEADLRQRGVFLTHEFRFAVCVVVRTYVRAALSHIGNNKEATVAVMRHGY